MTTGPRRAMAILFVAVAWFVAANHCALANLVDLAGRSAEHACCPAATPEPADSGMVCCDALVAPLPGDVAIPAVVVLPLSESDQPSVPTVVRAPSVEVREILPATGPPRGDLWVEIVFSRVVPAHGPPCSEV